MKYYRFRLRGSVRFVAPLAGAWIEMSKKTSSRLNVGRSLPSRERGLKYGYGQKRNVRGAVAPLAGAWIEIPSIKEGEQMAKRRSPRGSVD